MYVRRSISLMKDLPVAADKKYAKRLLSSIRQVVVHHSATDIQGTESDVAAIARHHVRVLGWPGIGYHYVIARDGTIWKTNDLRRASYHVAGANVSSIGVCLAGNLEKYPPTEGQVEALVYLVGELRQQFQPLPVFGHGELNPTACPGRYGREMLAKASWPVGRPRQA